jgi:hypothetical protein
MKKSVLIGMAALLLASSLAFVSCGDDSGGDSNAFVGTWTGTAYYYNNPIQTPATVKFTGSSWTFTAPSGSINESGTYNLSSDTLALLYHNGTYIGGATISNGILLFTFASGSLTGYSGQFNK